MPAASLANAFSAAIFRPSTSTMSREGAPRAKEIISAMPKNLAPVPPRWRQARGVYFFSTTAYSGGVPLK